jgi:hypothetical protein
MLADQAWLAKVMDVLGVAVAVISLLCSFGGNRPLTKDRSTCGFASVRVCLLEMRVKGFYALWPLLPPHEIISGEGPHRRHLEGLVDKAAQGGLGLPVVKGDGELRWRASGEERAQHLVRSPQLAWIERVDSGLRLMTSPQTKQIIAPLFGLGGFEAILALAEGHPGGSEAGFSGVQVGRLPEPAVDGLIGELITIMAMDQMVRPHRTIWRVVVKRSTFIQVFALVGSQGIVETAHAFGLHLGAG